jgi:3-oxoacyl-[acyl-carrier protein] reductase
MIDTGLNNKVALITGCNNPHGIGAATARAFAAQGARLFLHYFRSVQNASATGISDQAATAPGQAFYWRQQTKTADELVSAVTANGGGAACFETDLADPSSISRLFDQVEHVFGGVDILVNNAACSEADTFLSDLSPGEHAHSGFPTSTITTGTHDKNFTVNCRAPALMMAEFATRITRRGIRDGRIVNVSTDGASGFAGEVSYGASKHALESYSRAAAAELGKYGIRINIVSVGPTQTGWIAPELEKEIAAKTPLGRVGTPQDVADVIVFLASEQAAG